MLLIHEKMIYQHAFVGSDHRLYRKTRPVNFSCAIEKSYFGVVLNKSRTYIWLILHGSQQLEKFFFIFMIMKPSIELPNIFKETCYAH